MFQLNYSDPRPIYEQIVDKLKSLMVYGALKEDEQLPSVRELAAMLTINPNTIQKAYKELENEGYIYSVRGKGSFVAPMLKKGGTKHMEELKEAFLSTAAEMLYGGMSKETLKKMIDEIQIEKRGAND